MPPRGGGGSFRKTTHPEAGIVVHPRGAVRPVEQLTSSGDFDLVVAISDPAEAIPDPGRRFRPRGGDFRPVVAVVGVVRGGGGWVSSFFL